MFLGSVVENQAPSLIEKYGKNDEQKKHLMECKDGLMKAWAKLKNPEWKQPRFFPDNTEEYQYCPIGNYFYLHEGGMYDLNFENDPQFVGQALKHSLKTLNKLGGKSGINFDDPELYRTIVEDHCLTNYKNQVNCFPIKQN